MSRTKITFDVERVGFGRGINLRWLVRSENQEAVASRVEYTQITPDNEGRYFDPAMQITPDDAQGLMDELWRAGFRPTEGTGSAGSLAATERHLADMKAIAFHALKIGKP